MAHTKAKGSTKLGRESESKRLGVKRADGMAVFAGQIIDEDLHRLSAVRSGVQQVHAQPLDPAHALQVIGTVFGRDAERKTA